MLTDFVQGIQDSSSFYSLHATVEETVAWRGNSPWPHSSQVTELGFESMLSSLGQIPPTQYFPNTSSVILSQSISFPTYFDLTKFLFKQQSRFSTPPLYFLTSQVPIFNWLYQYPPSWRFWLSHNVGCYSLILRCLWSPPSTGGRWGEQNSKAHSLILHTPADSFEWLSAPGSTHVFRDQSRDLRHCGRSLTMQDPMSRASTLRSFPS